MDRSSNLIEGRKGKWKVERKPPGMNKKPKAFRQYRLGTPLIRNLLNATEMRKF